MHRVFGASTQSQSNGNLPTYSDGGGQQESESAHLASNVGSVIGKRSDVHCPASGAAKTASQRSAPTTCLSGIARNLKKSGLTNVGCHDLDDIHLDVQNDNSLAEQEARAKKLAESLQGVSYKIQVSAAKSIADRGGKGSLTLTVDALAFVADLQEKVAAEMLGSSGKEPVHLVFRDRALPVDVPVHFTGIRDGDTLELAAGKLVLPGEEEDDDDESDSGDSFDDAMLNWAS